MTCKLKKNRKKSLSSLMTNPRSQLGVSEIVGTLLIIGIGISLISVVSLFVFGASYLFAPETAATLSIVGTVDNEDYFIYFHHYGGESLPDATQIKLSIGGIAYQKTASELEGFDLQENKWSVGETLGFDSEDELGADFSVISFVKSEITVTITDANSNVLLLSTIQEGLSEITPSAHIYYYNLTSTSVTLGVDYDFIFPEFTDKLVYFEYSEDLDDPSWIIIGSHSPGDELTGSYEYDGLTSLEPQETYLFRAHLEYTIPDEGSYDAISGEAKFTTLSSLVAYWKFDDYTIPGSHPMQALDSSEYGNHGTLVPDQEEIWPLWQTENISGNSSLQFDGYNDYVTVPPSESLHFNWGDNLTLETWVKPLEKSEGIFGSIQPETRSFFGDEHLTFKENDVIHVTSNEDIHIFAIASCSFDTDSPCGILTTVLVDDNGTIMKPDETTYMKDHYVFENDYCATPQIFYVGTEDVDGDSVLDTVVAVIYQGAENKGVIKTFGINNSGVIVLEDGAAYTFSDATDHCYSPDVLPVEGADQMFVIAYSSKDHNGKLKTVTIGSDGSSITPEATLPFIDVYSQEAPYTKINDQSDLTHITNHTYCLVYNSLPNTEGSTSGWIMQNITISPETGEISLPDPDDGTFPFNLNGGNHVNFLRVNHVINELYTIIYSGREGDSIKCFVETLKIKNSGNVSEGDYPLDRQIFYDSDKFNNPALQRIYSDTDSDSFIVSFRGQSNYLRFHTFTISISDDITFGTISFPTSNTFTINQKYWWSDIYHLSSDTDVHGGYQRFVSIYSNYENDNDENSGILTSFKVYNNGDLLDPVIIESEKIGTVNFYEPQLVHIHGDVYAVIYKSSSSNGWGVISTFIMHSDGSYINTSFIDTFIFEPVTCYSLSVLQLATNHNRILISYIDNSNQGQLILLSISDEGTSIETVDKQPIINGEHIFMPTIKHISGNTYAVSYCQFSDYFSYLYTLTISDDDIAGDVNDSLRIDDSFFGTLFHTNQDTYVFTYILTGYVIQRLRITLDGTIEHGGEDNILTIQSPFYLSSILLKIHESEDFYVHVLTPAAGSVSWIETLCIPNYDEDPMTYIMGISTPYRADSLAHVVSDIYVLTNCSSYGYGYINSLRISAQGDISLNVTQQITYGDTTQFSSFSGDSDSKILPLQQGVFAVILEGNYDDGVIETFTIHNDTANQSIVETNDYKLWINNNTIFGFIRIFGGKHILECNLHRDEYPTSWHYIVLTFEDDEEPMLAPIVTLYHFYDSNTPENFEKDEYIYLYGYLVTGPHGHILGGYNALYDEFKLHKEAFTEDELLARYTDMIGAS